MPETNVVVHDYRADSNTGRIELHLKCHTQDENAEWHGPIMQYSCDPQMLRDRFNGNLEDFEAWAAREHRMMVGVHPDLHAELAAKKGTKL